MGRNLKQVSRYAATHNISKNLQHSAATPQIEEIVDMKLPQPWLAPLLRIQEIPNVAFWIRFLDAPDVPHHAQPHDPLLEAILCSGPDDIGTCVNEIQESQCFYLLCDKRVWSRLKPGKEGARTPAWWPGTQSRYIMMLRLVAGGRNSVRCPLMAAYLVYWSTLFEVHGTDATTSSSGASSSQLASGEYIIAVLTEELDVRIPKVEDAKSAQAALAALKIQEHMIKASRAMQKDEEAAERRKKALEADERRRTNVERKRIRAGEVEAAKAPAKKARK